MSRGKKRRVPVPPPPDGGVAPGEPGAGRRRLRPPKPTTTAGAIAELAIIVVAALAIAFGIQAWIVKPYRIPSGSMEPTLDVGQRILANRFIYRFEDPSIGDIAVFHPPAAAERLPQCGVPPRVGEPCPRPSPERSDQNFVKRIVAGPGDTLSVREGHPVVNGVWKRDEPYTLPCRAAPSCNLPRAITIPPGHYFMMGDNRGGSNDSRFWGPVPRAWIVGEAFFTYWPPSRLGSP